MANPVAVPPPIEKANGTTARSHRRQVALRLLLGTVAVAATALLAWAARGSVAAGFEGLTQASPPWVALALAAESVSMAALARQQRRVIGASPRGRVPLRTVLATTYGGNAISVSLPLAGSGVSAAFTYHRYVNAGTARPKIVTGLAVSGVLSASAFAVIVAVAALGSGRTALVAAGVGGLLASAVPVAAVLAALHSERMRAITEHAAARALSVVQRLVHHPSGDPATLAASALEQLAAARLRRTDVGVAFCLAVVNWTADVACLAFSLRAIGVALPLASMTLAWSAGAGASSLNLTPGSVGIVEAALTAALVAVGASASHALTGVLVYRLISFWLVLSIGLVLLALPRARSS